MFAQPNSTAQQSAPSSGNDNWRNDAFINVYLPKADGTGSRKIGAIGLKLRKDAEKALIDYLNANEGNIDALMSTATFDFQMVDGSTSAGFALPPAE